MTLAAVLLAAGQSRRFGPQNNQLADLQGKPLIGHAADHIRGLKPDIMIAVTASEAVTELLDDFTVVMAQDNPVQSGSIRLGIQTAEWLGAQRALIVLGDMPFADAALMGQVAATCTADTPSATTNGTRILPPACFPRSYFNTLKTLQGDKGAAQILHELPPAALSLADTGAIFDIDVPHDLNTAHEGRVM